MEKSGALLSTPFGKHVDDKSDICPHLVECHICMKPSIDPIATLCSHIFCWSCIYKWLQNEPKSCSNYGITLTRKMNIIALYELETSAKPTNNTINANEATTSTNVIPPCPPNSTWINCPDLHLTRQWEQRNSKLMQEAQERALQHLEEITRMAQDIVKLQLQLDQANDQLARANVLLPLGWSDGL